MGLYYISIFLLALYIVKGVYNWLHAIILRISLYIKLEKICKRHGFIMERPRFIFASFFRYSKRPDIVIKANGVDYIVRIITCRARKRIYHFVSHEWFVRAFKVYMLLPFMNSEDMVLFKRAKYIPPVDEKYLKDVKNKKQVVLLFNPSPLDITFTSRQSRRQIGSNGADFDGWLIYNGRAFAELLDNAQI